MKKIFFIIFLVTLLVIWKGPNITFAQKPVEVTYSVIYPALHLHTKLINEWGKEIEKRTNGRVKVVVFPGNTLTPPDKCYDGVVKGISGAGMAILAYTRGRFPLAEVIDQPLGYKNALGATKMINEFYKKFRPKEFDDAKVMYFHAHAPGVLHTTRKPVYKLEDLRGMKIRSTGMSAKIAAALGATPVAMPMSDSYDALSRGVADGTLMPFEPMAGFKLAEVLKYTTEYVSATYSTGFIVTMNKEIWNSFSPDVQNTIEKINEEWIDKTVKAWDELERLGREGCIKSGTKFYTLPKEEDERWGKLVRPILDEYVNNMKAKGLPGEEALKFCLEYLKRY
jgi:TRAP-type C4-dicarboxylate transport system substrate-binding protein